MSGLQRIHWAIAPKTAPRPLISCSRCGTVKAYCSSGKFRVNANGKRIDVWLIYRCIDCDNSWNFGRSAATAATSTRRCWRRSNATILHSLTVMPSM